MTTQPIDRESRQVASWLVLLVMLISILLIGATQRGADSAEWRESHAVVQSAK